MLTRRAFLGGASLSAAWVKGLRAARYDLVIKGGRVIDPAGHVDRVADVAIRGERISAVRPDIAAADAADVLDARGKLVVPGLIDVHVHVSAPDMTPAMLLRDGVTAMVDGGSAGADNIDALVRVARDAPNRVRIFLNLARTGVTAEGELMNIDAGDVDAARHAIAQHREWIAGVKVRLSETACGKHQ